MLFCTVKNRRFRSAFQNDFMLLFFSSKSSLQFYGVSLYEIPSVLRIASRWVRKLIFKLLLRYEVIGCVVGATWIFLWLRACHCGIATPQNSSWAVELGSDGKYNVHRKSVEMISNGRAELSADYCVSNTAARVRLRLQAACFDTYAGGWRLEERELASQSPSPHRSC